MVAAAVLAFASVPAIAAGSRASSTGTEVSKVTPSLAGVVAAGASVVDDVFGAVVTGHVPGTVYYLAKLESPVDAATTGAITKAGATIRARFDLVRWVALSSPLAAVARVAALPQVRRLTLDDVVHVSAESVQPLVAAAAPGFADQAKRGTHDIGADTMWNMGVTGGSVTVGVADSGVDSLHADLAPKLTGFVDCSGVLPNLLSDLSDALPALPDSIGSCLPTIGTDENGHGTHVSGIATGSGALNPELPGVAPSAKLKVAKVCNAGGVCLNSSVMAGIQYLAVNGAQVINMSLGGDRFYLAGLSPAEQITNVDNPEAELVDALADHYNVVFSIAAGNSGPGLQSVGSPAVASQSMAVAASIADWDLDHSKAETLHGVYGPIRPEAAAAGAYGIAQFSSRGPSGDRLIKPEVSAPGSYVVAAESLLGAEVKAGELLTGHNFATDLNYAVLSGTSMAAPSNAGAAALVIDGYRQATGATPNYYVVKAALAGTADDDAFEGPVTGLLSSIRASRFGEDPATLFPLRNEEWVGITGEGAGRVNVPQAYLASTAGVVAYTPAQRVDGVLTTHSLQPNWALDDLAPGESASQTFLVRGGPKMASPAPVTWSVEDEAEATGIGTIPASWLTLPGATVAKPGVESAAAMSIRIPAGTEPGMYAGAVIGTARLGDVTQRLRIPVQVFVPIPADTAIEGLIFTTGPTDYSVVGLESPLGGIATDWVMVPLRLPADATDVTLSVYDPAGAAHMDVFAFDGSGQEIDSSVSPYLEQGVPLDLLLTPTGPDSPNEVTLLSDTDWIDVELPTTVWIVVSDTVPGTAPGFETFHLDVSVATGAQATTTTTGLLPLAQPAPAPAPATVTSSVGAVGDTVGSTVNGLPVGASRPPEDSRSQPVPIAVVAVLLDAVVLAAVTRRLLFRATAPA